jgi:hypothetical protein
MRTVLALALATVAVAATTAQAAAAAPLQRSHGMSPCPAPPSTYKPAPFDSLTWNWEIGQWVAACGIGQLDGPRKLAATLHLSTADNRTIATHYAAFYVKSVLPKVPALKAIAQRIGLARVQSLMVAGVLTGFRLRGRP